MPRINQQDEKDRGDYVQLATKHKCSSPQYHSISAKRIKQTHRKSLLPAPSPSCKSGAPTSEEQDAQAMMMMFTTQVCREGLCDCLGWPALTNAPNKLERAMLLPTRCPYLTVPAHRCLHNPHKHQTRKRGIETTVRTSGTG